MLHTPCPDCAQNTPSGGLTFVDVGLSDPTSAPNVVAQLLTAGEVLTNQLADISSLTGGNVAQYAVLYAYATTVGNGVYWIKGSVQKLDGSVKSIFMTNRNADIRHTSIAFAFIPLSSQQFYWTGDASESATNSGNIVVNLVGYFY